MSQFTLSSVSELYFVDQQYREYAMSEGEVFLLLIEGSSMTLIITLSIA